MRSENIETYRNMLRVNKHRLDDELEIQAEVMDRIGQQLTLANSRAIEAEDSLKKVEARLFREFKDAGEKVTDATAKSESLRHRDRTQAWEAYQLTRATHQEWQVLYEAWKARGFSLKELGELFGTQYFQINSIQRRDDTDAIRERMRDANREANQQPPPMQEETPRRRRATIT